MKEIYPAFLIMVYNLFYKEKNKYESINFE